MSCCVCVQSVCAFIHTTHTHIIPHCMLHIMPCALHPCTHTGVERRQLAAKTERSGRWQDRPLSCCCSVSSGSLALSAVNLAVSFLLSESFPSRLLSEDYSVHQDTTHTRKQSNDDTFMMSSHPRRTRMKYRSVELFNVKVHDMPANALR